jgi:cbb3-type cytochrome oxidase subunit 3
MALIIGWIPLLFPTGNLPSPRWRVPAAIVLTLLGIGLIASAFRPGAFAWSDLVNPFGVDWWPVILQPFVDAIPLAVLATLLLAVVAVITRYRRGDRVMRLQIRWFVTAVAIVPLSLVGMLIEVALRTAGRAGADAPNALISALVTYAAILALPIAIGIAVTRYRLYEIDRLISRTIGWTLVTGVLVAVFGGTVIGLQAILDRVMQGQTLAVAASTLIAFALFQPVRRRVQQLVDHRFDRARYDGDRTAAAFAERLRAQVDLAGLEVDIAGVVDGALRPTTVGVWIRRPGHRDAA